MSSNPFDQFDGPTIATPADAQMATAPQSQAPQPSPAPQAANPFDQFDGHDHAPIPAPTSNGATPSSPSSPDRTEALRTDIANLINSGGTRADIDKRARQDGLTADQLPNLDQALAYRDHGGNGMIPVGILAPQATPAAAPAPPVNPHGADKGGMNAAVTGAIDSMLLGAGDELGGAVDATGQSIANAFGLGNGKSWGENYAASRDDTRQQMADAAYYHPALTIAGQLGGGALSLPLGGELSAGRAALEGAAYGGAYGFNSANGGIGDRLAQGAEGALLGGVTGGVIGGAANRVARGIEANRATPSAGRAILNAADRLNAGVDPSLQVRPLPGHVSDGGVAAIGHALLEPNLIGGSLSGLHSAANRFEENGGAALQRIADGVAGGPVDNLTTVAARANDEARPGSLAAYGADSKQASDAIYNNAEQLSNGARLGTPRTINAIDDKLAEWREVPGGVPGQSALEDLREQLANGTFTVQGLRRLRTSFGDGIDSSNRTVKEAAKTLWGPLSQDITMGLRSAGMSDAANAYRSADRNYAQRAANMDVISKVIGKDSDLSADAVAGRLQSMSSNDYDKLGQAMSAIDPAQANEIRGGLIHSLGQRQASRETEPGQFSFESFATRWNKLSDQAKATTFAPATVRDLNDLSTLALANRGVNRLGNSSRSGTAIENWRQARGVGEVVGGLTVGAAHPALLAGLAGTGAIGHILAYPGVARAIVAAGENRPAAFVARRLSEAARRNPAAEADILGLRDQLAANPNAVAIPENSPQP